MISASETRQHEACLNEMLVECERGPEPHAAHDNE
jgi:hypothetical protein